MMDICYDISELPPHYVQAIAEFDRDRPSTDLISSVPCVSEGDVEVNQWFTLLAIVSV